MIKKRVLSLLLAAAMIFSMCIPAVLVTAAGEVTTPSNTWCQTFTGFADNGTPGGMSYSNSTPATAASYMSIKGVGGLLGKADDDIAANIKSTGGVAESGKTTGYELRRSPTAATGSTITTSEVFHFSFEYAADNRDQSRAGRWSVTASGTGGWMGAGGLFSTGTGANGAITAYGQTIVPGPYPLNKWMRFDYLFYNVDNGAGSFNTVADIYVDGVLKATAASVSTGISAIGYIKGFGVLQLTMSQGLNAGNVYIDNIYHAKLASKPTIAPVSLSHANAGVIIDNTARTITSPGGFDTDGFIAGLGGTNVKSVVAVKSGGVAQTGTNALVDGYIIVTDNNGQFAYYTLSVEADAIAVSANVGSGYIVSGSQKKIYIPAATTQVAFLGNVTLTNCTLEGIYTNAACTTPAGDTNITSGRFLRFQNAAATTVEVYEVAIFSGVLGIESSTHYVFNNTTHTIFAPVGTPASVYYSRISPYAGHTGKLVDAAGTQVADNTAITRGAGLKYRVSFNGTDQDYTLITENVLETFDTWVGKSGSYAGLTYTGTTGSTATGVELDGEPVLKMSSTQGSNGDDIRKAGLTKGHLGTNFVVTLDVMVDNANAATEVIMKNIKKSDGSTDYNTFLHMKADKTITVLGQSLGTYEPNRWYRFAVVCDVAAQKSQIYINGKKVFDGTTTSLLSTTSYITDYIVKAYHSGTRNTWIDNFGFYQIYNSASFDASIMDSTLSNSGTYNVVQPDGTVTGYGAATAGDLKTMLKTAVGAVINIYQADGITQVLDSSLVQEGMKISVTSANGYYTSVYPVGKQVRSELSVKIDNIPVAYLIAGTNVTAHAVVYAGAGTNLQLRTRFKQGAAVGYTTLSNTASVVSGAKTLDLTVTGFSPTNIAGDEIIVELLQDDAVIDTLTLNYSGDRTYQSEILPVKNGYKSITTITSDDGLKNTYTKMNTYLKAAGIHASAVIPYNTAASDIPFYTNIFAQGNIDVTSHSYTHGNLSSDVNYGQTITDAIRKMELVDSRNKLAEAFPGQDVATFAPSNNALDAGATVIMQQTYWGARQGNAGYNTLTPSEGASAGQWYNLYMQRPLDKTTVTAQVQLDNMNSWVDNVITKGGWMIEMWHGINEGYLPIYDDVTAKAHIDYIGAKQASGETWGASLSEATKYLRERQWSTISDATMSNVRTVNINMNQPVTDPALPKYDIVFDYPLTVKSEVPADWQYVKVTQAGKVKGKTSFAEGGKYYVMYDGVPNGGDIRLEKADTLAMDSIDKIVISGTGTLAQTQGSTTAVQFTAAATPDANVDTTGVEWYVNNVKQSVAAGSLAFSYTPTAIGSYSIYAKDSLSGIQSNSVTITVVAAPLPGELFFYDFSGASIATGTGKNQWQSNGGATLAKSPTDPTNQVAKFNLVGTQQWPYLWANTAVAVGTTIVYSGKVYIHNAPTDSPSASLELRKGDGTNLRQTAATFKTTQITSLGGASIGTIEPDSWVKYNVAYTPAAAGQPSTIRLSASGPGVKGTTSVAQPVFSQRTAVMDNLDVDNLKKAIMIYNNSFSATATEAATYIDDVVIYNPSVTTVTAPLTAVAPAADVDLIFNNDVYGITPSSVVVTKNGGAGVAVSQVVVDSLTPSKATLKFAAGALEPNSTYTVSFNSGVIDVLGSEVLATTTFSTDATVSESSISLNYTSYTYCENTYSGLIKATINGEPSTAFGVQSSDEAVATWGTDGKLYLHSAGRAKLTFTANADGGTAALDITVIKNTEVIGVSVARGTGSSDAIAKTITITAGTTEDPTPEYVSFKTVPNSLCTATLLTATGDQSLNDPDVTVTSLNHVMVMNNANIAKTFKLKLTYQSEEVIYDVTVNRNGSAVGVQQPTALKVYRIDGYSDEGLMSLSGNQINLKASTNPNNVEGTQYSIAFTTNFGVNTVWGEASEWTLISGTVYQWNKDAAVSLNTKNGCITVKNPLSRNVQFDIKINGTLYTVKVDFGALTTITSITTQRVPNAAAAKATQSVAGGSVSLESNAYSVAFTTSLGTGASWYMEGVDLETNVGADGKPIDGAMVFYNYKNGYITMKKPQTPGSVSYVFTIKQPGASDSIFTVTINWLE